MKNYILKIKARKPYGDKVKFLCMLEANSKAEAISTASKALPGSADQTDAKIIGEWETITIEPISGPVGASVGYKFTSPHQNEQNINKSAVENP